MPPGNVRQSARFAPQQALSIFDADKGGFVAATNNNDAHAIKGSIDNIRSIDPTCSHIEAFEKDNHFEQLIKDVRNKHSIGGYNRLREGKHQKNNMGSNVSRHSAKRLSGRRTLSSGLYI